MSDAIWSHLLSGFDHDVSYSTPKQGVRRSLEFRLSSTDLKLDTNMVTKSIALRFRCNASCGKKTLTFLSVKFPRSHSAGQ